MMNDVKTKLGEQELGSIKVANATPALKQVEEIKEAVDSVVSETSLSERVDDLRTWLDNLSEEVESWRSWHKNTYLEAIETLKSAVEEIQNEWNNVSASMKTQREKLESLLHSFPGVIETATLKALSLRVAHLEQLISELFQESHARSTTIGSRKQLLISLVALGITVILWGVFIGLNVIW